MSNITAKARELRKLLEYVTETLDDQTALSVATFVERWKPDTAYEVGKRVSYKPADKVELWKCRQAHTSQTGWEPSTDTASLWERIDEIHSGAIDDPIPYNENLTVYKDLYYTEDGVLYLCTRDSGQPLYATAASLVGNYFEVVNDEEEPTPEPTPEPESTPDPEPEPTPEPTEEIPEWTQPDAGNPYMTGDKVTYEGVVYESTIDNNVWSPAAYPAGWKVVE